MLKFFVGERVNLTLTVRGLEPDTVTAILTPYGGTAVTVAATILTAYDEDAEVSIWRAEYEFPTAGQWDAQARANESTDETFHNYRDGQHKLPITVLPAPV